jgi:alpha/beta superfamily hydrolase
VSTDDMTAPAAMRVDERAGTRDEVRFVGGASDRLITMISRPPAFTAGGVIVCSGIGNDFLRSYRREVLLSRTLAAKGWATLRFHYRGTGNSEGAAADCCFESMTTDTLTAARALDDLTPTSVDVIVATRIGALVAASAIGRSGATRLVLVDPVIEGRRFFKEAWRADKVQVIADDDIPTDPIANLASWGETAVLGTTLHQRLFESLDGRSLVDVLDAPPLHILWVKLGRRDPSPHEAKAVEAVERAGHTVTLTHIGRAQAWWVLDDDADEMADELVNTVTTWITDES